MTAATAERKTERITARIAPNVLEKIEYAASLQGATINQFLISSALVNAENIIEHERRLQLSQDEARRFLDIIDTPPKPNDRLCAALQSYQEDSLNVERKD
ncbi:MAG: DUF1778 domain-containing protein [Pontibacterium sp.]